MIFQIKAIRAAWADRAAGPRSAERTQLPEWRPDSRTTDPDDDPAHHDIMG
jgi:hypothetical protein